MTVLKRHPVDRTSISQEFGVVSNRGTHPGIDYRPDYPGQTDFPVYAAHDGFVVFARGTAHVAGNPWEQIPGNGNNGNSVIIQAVAPHQACATSYNHLGTIAVKEGQWVTAGTFLGYMGWTGFVIGQWGWNGWQTDRNPSGTHLHFELFIDYGNGQYPEGTYYGRVNPLEYFAVETTVPIAPGSTGGSSTNKNQEWYLMPDIPTSNLLQIEAALMSKDYGAWLQQQVVKAPIKSTDGKVWPLHSHIYGITQRQQQQDGKLAGMLEILRQIAAGAGTPIDYAKVTEAVRVGVEQGKQLTAQEIADAVLDEQAERLTKKETAS